MIATFLRWLAGAAAVVFLLGVSSCASDPAPPEPIGALGPAPGASSPHSGQADEMSDENSPGEQSGPTGPAPASQGDYPTGYKTDKPHQVISPYKPHNLIDISENPKTGKPFGSGDLVKDPSNQKIFVIP